MKDYPCILIWDANTRMGHNIGPYAYGISHTRMANIRIWGGTEGMGKTGRGAGVRVGDQ